MAPPLEQPGPGLLPGKGVKKGKWHPEKITETRSALTRLGVAGREKGQQQWAQLPKNHHVPPVPKRLSSLGTTQGCCAPAARRE